MRITDQEVVMLDFRLIRIKIKVIRQLHIYKIRLRVLPYKTGAVQSRYLAQSCLIKYHSSSTNWKKKGKLVVSTSTPHRAILFE